MLPRRPSPPEAIDRPSSGASALHPGASELRPPTAFAARDVLPDIPGYTIERELGRGGSATVYLAREHKHDRRVAVKVLHPALAASLQAQRFLREIEILSSLTHPNILPLIDSAVAGDLLFYVMPYVSGESLRARLDRERTLSIEVAVRITREVAAALDYAHREGFVHRDIKPENILLVDGHAVVADFGIGRAINVATDGQLTSGSVIGTPLYMSPEQISAKREIDGRSDIYSLGCVFYELVSGAPPFAGTDAQQIVLHHLADAAPSLRASMPSVPRSVSLAIAIALEKSPDRRFDTANAFADALDVAGFWRTRGRAVAHFLEASSPLRMLGYTLVAGGLLSAVVLATTATTATNDRVNALLVDLGLRDPQLDTTRYVVLPVDTSASMPAVLDVAGALEAGFQRWRDITVEDLSQVSEAVRRASHLSPSERASRAATSLRAGRYVSSQVTRDRDSVSVTAMLFDTRTRRLIARAGVRVAVQGDSTPLVIRRLADSLLFPDGLSARRALNDAATNSVEARRAYARGHLALEDGEFTRADSEFTAATRSDERFGQALLWLGTVRRWAAWQSQTSTATWPRTVTLAEERRAALPPRERRQLDALSAMAEKDYGRGCAIWRQLAAADPNDYAFWYALGDCLHYDHGVVRGSRDTPWHFRSSMNESVLAFVHAFRAKPSMLHAFAGQSLDQLRALMFTSSVRLLGGRAVAPDTLEFRGYPIWQGDSLTFIPVLLPQPKLVPLPESVGEAVQKQRYRFRDVAMLWSTEFPTRGEAVEALAISMEMLGDRSALETMRRARGLASSDGDRLRMGVTEVWLRFKFAIPSTPRALDTAFALADSILLVHPVGPHEENVGSLAALTGQASRAAAYARTNEADDSLPAIANDGPALLAFASLGGPADSLRTLEQIIDASINAMPGSARTDARRNWLARAATLAYPEYQSRLLDAYDTGLQRGNLVAASIAHDSTRVRSLLATLSEARRNLRPSDIMPDGLLPEAAALAQLGDISGAIARLDPTLGAIRSMASEDLARNSQAGSLMRAIVLRADLAQAVGDTATARLWAKVVLPLWSRADPFLQPVVQRMRQFAR